MRIWCQLPPSSLCDQHLLAQWREGLGLWSILANDKPGYRNHPETLRWIGHPTPLWFILEATREAMLSRKWNPKPMPSYTPWPLETSHRWPTAWDDQLSVLRAKGCKCKLPPLETPPGASQ